MYTFEEIKAREMGVMEAVANMTPRTGDIIVWVSIADVHTMMSSYSDVRIGMVEVAHTCLNLAAEGKLATAVINGKRVFGLPLPF